MTTELVTRNTESLLIKFDVSELRNSAYVSMLPTNASIFRVLNWLRNHSPLDGHTHRNDAIAATLRSGAHVTVMYSPEHGLDLSVFPDPTRLCSYHKNGLPIPAKVSRFTFWEGHKGTGVLVAELESPDLTELNSVWQSRGLVSTYPEYKPHMTLLTPYTEDVVLLKVINAQLEEYPMKIELVDENIEPIS